MIKTFAKTAMWAAVFTLPLTAHAQAPAAAPPPPAPTYTSLVLELTINRPAAAVWAEVGGYCKISEWLGTTCAITSGKDGELGAVRVLNNGAVIEILAAKTPLSYTYTQPVRVGVPYNLYHGTLEVQPVTANTSKLLYSFVYDNAMLANDEARAAERKARTDRFMAGMVKMKAMAEAG